MRRKRTQHLKTKGTNLLRRSSKHTRKNLPSYTQKPWQQRGQRQVDEYRQLLKVGGLTEAERQHYTDLIVSPDAIATELLDVDYGENADRAAELATFIQHPEMVEEQTEQR